MENVRPWCGQPSDRGRLRTVQNVPVGRSVGSGHLAVGGATAAAGDALTTPSDVAQGLRQTPVEYGEQEQ